ncbi:response regulator [Leptodesmis sichuanensis]|uniref:response regulator n=1 Tax=Leptodesmis sichuanensis TaxID=2906798 RepID=UPI001F232562|nr:response regulator [Leptodesmis sichuanensis]UIE37206.1 response regulator [Leptodesmis sichuanensis A121]
MHQEILLIEDDYMFRWRLLHFLEDQGYSVLEAENGMAGIKLARNHQPALILCDIGMPQFNGYDVLKQLQKDPKTASIPLIFLTNRGESECSIALKAGAKECLSKALSFEQVLERLLHHLMSSPLVNKPPELELSEWQ